MSVKKEDQDLYELLWEICDLAFNVERPRSDTASYEAHKKLREMIGYKLPYEESDGVGVMIMRKEKALRDTEMVAHNLHCELNATKAELEKAKKAYDIVVKHGESVLSELSDLRQQVLKKVMNCPNYRRTDNPYCCTHTCEIRKECRGVAECVTE